MESCRRQPSMLHLFLIFAYLPSSVLAKLLFPDGTPIPEFVGAVENVTVPVGRDAIFTCNVKNLGRFKIGWVKSDTKAIQSIHNEVVTLNQRVQVTGDFVSMFNLHIQRVQQEDRGQYMCQINTNPLMQQTATLDVNIPPDIKIEKTTKDFETQVGSTVSLECHAEGYPDPSISWQREDKKYLRVKEDSGEIKNHERYEGNRLTIPQVTQDDMGGYLCIASNKVPPAMSKRVYMYVQFPPQIYAREPLLGIMEGRALRMRCDITAYPKPIIYWMHEGNMVLSSGQFEVFDNDTSKSEMTSILIVRNVTIRNMGKYECVAKNPFGAAEANVRAYLVSSTESPRSTTTLNGNDLENLDNEEDRKKVKKRRRQKTERQKVEDSLLDENSEQLGFGSISSENMHGPGYTTFEQNPDRIENRSSKSSKNNFCSNLFVFVISLTALVVVMLR